MEFTGNHHTNLLENHLWEVKQIFTHKLGDNKAVLGSYLILS